MAQVRIVLVELKGILHDVIRGVVEREADMRIVADLEDEDLLLDTIAKTAPDFVIWADGAVSERTRLQLPRVKVLAVENGGRTGVLWESIGELSPGRLLEVLRVGHA